MSDSYNITSAYIEITDKCNAKCPFCYDNSHSSNCNILPFPSIQRLVENLDKNLKLITISGGEPFLHPDITKIIDFVLNNKLQCSVISNGTAISKDFLKTHQNELFTLHLSIHSFCSEKHDFVTGVKGSYEKVFNIVEYIYNNDLIINVELNFLVTAQNYNELRIIKNNRLVQMADKVNIHFITFSGREIAFDYLLSDKNIDKVCSELCKNHLDKNEKCSLPRLTSICKYATDDETVTVGPRVDAKGFVYPCTQFFDEKFIVGNIFYNTLEEIFSGEKMVDFREKMRTWINGNEKCSSCFARKVCKGGCPAKGYLQKGNHNEDIMCGQRMKYFITKLRKMETGLR